MPCEYWGEDRNSVDKRTKEKLDNLTRLLCIACKELENEVGQVYESDLSDWWEDHRKEDIARIKSEALAKLTREEKKVLGL